MKPLKNRLAAATAAVLCLLLVSGCQLGGEKVAPKVNQSSEAEAEPTAAPSTATKPASEPEAAPTARPKDSGRYLDFADIKIPRALTVNRNASFVYHSDALTGGVLALSGRAAMDRTVTFFEDQMPRDGWTLLSSFKYNKKLLIYIKDRRVCLIQVESAFTPGELKVEVWLAPSKQAAALHFTGRTEPAPARSSPSAPVKEERLTEEGS
jgi:hypothetical protein